MEKTRRPCAWPGMVAAALGAIWLALFPLWQDGSFSRITRAKWQGMLILCAVTAAAVIVTLVILALRGELGRNVRFHPAQALMLAYFAWVALSAFQGAYAQALNSSGQRAALMGAIRH